MADLGFTENPVPSGRGFHIGAVGFECRSRPACLNLNSTHNIIIPPGEVFFHQCFGLSHHLRRISELAGEPGIDFSSNSAHVAWCSGTPCLIPGPSWAGVRGHHTWGVWLPPVTLAPQTGEHQRVRESEVASQRLSECHQGPSRIHEGDTLSVGLKPTMFGADGIDALRCRFEHSLRGHFGPCDFSAITAKRESLTMILAA